MIQTFTKIYNLNPKKMLYIDKDQSQIQDLPFKKDKDIVIVTYTPYNTKLIKVGYKEIASTKNINNILIIDAICTTKEILNKNKKRLEKLKKILDKSIKEIQENPEEAYKLTAKYLNNISYDEYKSSMKTIKWIHKPSKELLLKLKTINYMENNFI
jgi:NitT/TauT family transport system substrate-binding protein